MKGETLLQLMWSMFFLCMFRSKLFTNRKQPVKEKRGGVRSLLFTHRKYRSKILFSELCISAHIGKMTAYSSGGFRGGAPLFAENLPSNFSKTQDLRPKIRYFIAISGGGPPCLERPPPFSKFLDPPLYH